MYNEEIKLYKCRVYLFCNYELLGINSVQIGKECGVCGFTIRKWLRNFNIRIKTKSEITSGKKNSMYGRIGEKSPTYGKHWSWSEESKEKISGKNNPNYGRTGEKHPMFGKTGKNHPNWKGDDVKNLSVNQIHIRVRKVKPKPADGKCKLCHKIADKKGRTKLELYNITKYHHLSLNPDDYQYAHKSCHKGYDNKSRKERKLRRFKENGRNSKM
ncbi:hypothetical protein LCGC14_1594820 [marine sediment metagenome]|uniref:Nuclease associated modular domain-containing protein n=1 Tax=marine sediment metagenome TaxID=412755 RepID=A0A0F9KTM4_9ZZZZ